MPEGIVLAVAEVTRSSIHGDGFVTFESLVTARSADAADITRVKVATSLRIDQWEAAGRPTTLDVVLAQPDRG